MLLRLVPPPGRHAAHAERSAYPFAETPLMVAFAAVDDLTAVGPGARVALAAAPEVSADDAYLVLPRRAREGLHRAFATGNAGVVAGWMHDAVVTRAEVDAGAAPRMWVGAAWRAADVIASQGGRAVKLGPDAARAVNALPFVAGLSPAGMIDAQGVEAVLRRERYVGAARRGDDAHEPTFVWSEHDAAGVRVRVALSAPEDDAVIALLAPLTLVA